MATPTAASLPVLPAGDSADGDISCQRCDHKMGGRLTDFGERAAVGRLTGLIDSADKSVTAQQRRGAAMDGIYSPFRAAVFIGQTDTQTEEWREGKDKEWIHRVTDKGVLIEDRATDAGMFW